MRAVFLDKETFSATVDLSAIEQHVTELQSYAKTSPEEITERCLNAEIIITNKVVLTAEILSVLPKLKLKVQILPF